MISKEDLELIENALWIDRKKFTPDLEEIDLCIEDCMKILGCCREEAITYMIQIKEHRQTVLRIKYLVEVDYLEQQAKFLQTLLIKKPLKV